MEAKKIKLDEIIDYHEESIVSRMLINRECGNITLFSFDKGQSLSEHTAPYDVLLYIIDGTAKVKISHEEVFLNKGEAVIIPANKPHEVHAVEKFKMMLVMIR